MFGRDAVRFLEGPRGLIVGLVESDGQPFATRAWGISVVSAGDGVLRVLLSAEVAGRAGLCLPSRPIAVTAADIETLRSMQVKGLVTDVEDATAGDRERAREHADGFFDLLVQTDGMDRALLERIVPEAHVAATVVVEEAFDQTPGPGAGAPVGTTGT